ncbi:MAG: hypothetical protein V1794_16280 [Candidatus Glassbacteria bacterium]
MQYRLTLMFWALALASLIACGPSVRFEPGRIEPARLASDAGAAGFDVVSTDVAFPAVVTSNVEFRTLPYSDSVLTELRTRYHLPEVIAGARDELDAQMRLKHWVWSKIENGTPTVEANNALEILEQAAAGKKFWCSYYAITYTQCALALGWQARKIALDHYHEPGGVGSRHHGAAEVWSNQLGKWIYMDSQSDAHYEKNGVPLSAWEIRAEWLADGGKGVDHVVGVPPDTVHKKPAIVWWDLKDQDETALFFWLFYTDDYSTWEENSPSKFIFPQDSANAGRIWYQGGKDNLYAHTGYLKKLFHPTQRLGDVYYTVGVVDARLTLYEGQTLLLALDTWLPDFSHYEASLGEGPWQPVAEPSALRWPLAKGNNRLALRTVNQAGVAGPVSRAEMVLE